MSTTDGTPNILFVFTDQQRWDSLGCYGQGLDVSPNLDRMAADGVLYQSAFTPQPLCGPGRACVQTGMFATETGCFHNQIALPADTRTIADWLNVAGYETGYIGKWHLASSQVSIDIPGVEEKIDFHDKPVPLERRGGYKDYWLASDILEFTSHGYGGYMYDKNSRKVEFPEGRFRADCLTDYALEFIDSHDRDRPFFLFISYVEPHIQNDTRRYEGPTGSKERFRDYTLPGDLQDTDGRWLDGFADYLGSCNSLDHNIGRLIDALEENGELENTLIIYTSDHGDHFGTRYRGHKRTCHESSIRIPMILSGPGFRSGSVETELVSLIDLPPTILAAAGIDVPRYMRGKPLQILQDGESAAWKKEVFIQISSTQTGRALRTKKWKYAVNTGELFPAVNPDTRASDVYYEAYLYDLENDPHEKDNLVDDAALEQTRSRLADILKRRIEEVENLRVAINPRVGEEK